MLQRRHAPAFGQRGRIAGAVGYGGVAVGAGHVRGDGPDGVQPGQANTLQIVPGVAAVAAAFNLQHIPAGAQVAEARQILTSELMAGQAVVPVRRRGGGGAGGVLGQGGGADHAQHRQRQEVPPHG